MSDRNIIQQAIKNTTHPPPSRQLLPDAPKHIKLIMMQHKKLTSPQGGQLNPQAAISARALLLERAPGEIAKQSQNDASGNDLYYKTGCPLSWE